MKLAPTSALSLLRLTRLATWARLWLELAAFVLRTYFPAGPLPAWVARPLRANVGKVRALVVRVIFLQAVARLDLGGGRRLLPRRIPGAFRAAIGSALRRAMRGRTLSDQIYALLNILYDLETFIVRLVRRGLTRLADKGVLPIAVELFASPFYAPLFAGGADTS